VKLVAKKGLAGIRWASRRGAASLGLNPPHLNRVRCPQAIIFFYLFFPEASFSAARARDILSSFFFLFRGKVIRSLVFVF